MDATSLLPERSIEDILAERVRLTIGGEIYDLPALPIADSERWLAGLEGDFLGLLFGVELLGDDAASIITRLSGHVTTMLDALYAYDRTNVLPPRGGIEQVVTPLWAIRSLMEVWRAANPLVDIGLAAGMTDPPRNASEPPTSSPSPNGVSPLALSGVG